mgnify:CR=1 FL=1
MKLNEIDFNLLSDKELINLSLKYNILTVEEIKTTTRKQLLELIKAYLQKKLKVYGEKKTETKSVKIERRMSTSGKLQGLNKAPTIPRATRERRMSQPITNVEKVQAGETIEKNYIKRESQGNVKKEIKSLNPQYDNIGMYPPVKRLVSIGDVHGDLRATLTALKLSMKIVDQRFRLLIKKYVF